MLERIIRLFRHRWLDDGRARRTIPAEVAERLMQRVRASEQRHSGEIRICVETSLPTSYLLRKAPMREITRQRAVSLFGKLRVWDTEHNNGVLIYLLLPEHAIELVADRALMACLSPDEWQAMLARMREAFQQGHFEEGLTQALAEISAVLVQHFPQAPGRAERNELPDHPHVI